MTLLQQWMDREGKRDLEVSLALDISRVQVLRLRRGQYRPSVETARKLEMLTGIPAPQFIFGEAA